MHHALRPMLGYKAESIYDIELPCFASFKFDGWRGIWQGLEFFSRTGKTIPNRALQAWAKETGIPPGWDGEIIVGDPTAKDVFSKTDSFCKTMRKPIPAEGVRFFVFDNCFAQGPYDRRLQSLQDLPGGVVKVDQRIISTYDELEEFENYAVELGYEGICTRTPLGKYKHGRSTKGEQYLIKLKRYIDEECRIIGVVPLHRNLNEPFTNEIGYTKRSSHREGKVPDSLLGALIVDWRGKELRVGSGPTLLERRQLWEHRDELIGQFATIKYSPVVRDLPRQPILKGIRSPHEL